MALVLLAAAPGAEAGRRGLRVDLGAWSEAQEIALGGGETCTAAGWDAQVPSPGPGPTVFWGWVWWEGLQFTTSAFEGLNSFYCQYSKPYTPGAFEEEYLNAAVFGPDEADLAAMIGANQDNAVHAARYSFLGDYPEFLYGRQWAFYFFPDGLTVVALHGAADGQATYEWIYDPNVGYLWQAATDFWDGGYFCFQNGAFLGDCVAPTPPPEEIFRNGFEPE